MPRSWRCFLHPRLQKLRKVVASVLYTLVCTLRPIQKNRVILATNRSSALADNLLAIHDALDPAVFSIDVFLDGHTSVVGKVIRDLKFVTAMAQAEYTLVDDFFPLVYPLRLREGARLIQVWHALGALKRVGYSRGSQTGAPLPTSVTHKNYTDVIVSADSVRANYAEGFGVPLCAVHALGAPRSDLFFDPDRIAAARQTVYEHVPALRGRRVIQFAPTFRGVRKRDAYYPQTLLDLAAIAAALGERDLFIIRMHPFVTRRPAIPPEFADKIIDLSDYPEFNHLLTVTDLLVTDYSSAIFDYAFLGRPIVFYVPDLDTYDGGRGFYCDFDAYTYGPVVRDVPGLVQALATTAVDPDKLAQFRERFLNRCDGHSTQRFIAQILGQAGATRPAAEVMR